MRYGKSAARLTPWRPVARIQRRISFASTVWTERNGNGVAVFHQETPIASLPAPAKKK